MHNTLRSATLALLAPVALTILAAGADKKEFRYTVGAGAGISIVNDFGPVTVRPSSGNQVIISATPRSSKVEVDSSQSGNRVEARSHLLQRTGQDEGRVDYDVQVPADANLMLRSSNGTVRVEGINGDVAVDADSSSVEVNGCNGHVRVRTASGPITLSNIHNGHIEATSVGGQVTLKQVSGAVVTVNTTAGAINYAGDFSEGGEYSLSSHSGNIEVSLPANASVDVTATSVNGAVENDFPFAPKAHPTIAITQGRSFAGTSNSGASSVRLRTFSGKIRVKKQ